MRSKKNKAVSLFKIRIILFTTSLLFYSCQKDEITPILNQSSSTSKVKIITLNAEEISKNNKVKEILKKAKKNKSNLKAKSKTNNQDFYIDTSFSKYIESDDGKLHSYTFLINRNKKNIENLLLALNKKGGYDAYIVSYGFSKQEKVNMTFDDFKSTEIIIKPINFDASTLNIQARTLQHVCIEYQTKVKLRCCEGDLCRADSDYCIANGGTGYHYEWVTDSKSCEWINSGGEKSNDSNSTTISSSGGGGSSTTTVLVDTTPYTSQLKQFQSGTLNSIERTYYSSDFNIKNTIDRYLIQNNFSDFSKFEAMLNLEFGFSLNLNYQQFNWTFNNRDSQEVKALKKFSASNTSEKAINFVKGQIELEILIQNTKRNWKAKSGIIANNPNLKYTHYDFDGIRGYYKMTDGSIIVSSSFEQKLTKSGELTDKYRDNSGVDLENKYYYIKLHNSELWAEMLFNPESTADQLETLFKLAGIELGKSIGRYVLPIEDIKILIDGKDFDGQKVARWKAAGFLLLAVVPGSKALKIVGNVADATSIVLKLGGSTLVVDTVKAGLKVVSNSNAIKFVSKTGDEIARVVNGVMTFKYAGFGGNIITNANKTTTLIGKYNVNGVGTKNIIDSGLSKSGKNTGGLNVLSETPNPNWNDQQIWDNINEPWLRDAANRNDVIRVVSDPLNNNNLRNIDGSLTFFGREHELLTKPISNGGLGYTYNPVTYTYTK